MDKEVWTEFRPFEPITDRRHPRVWLRLLIRGISAWLDKPTKAEAAHKGEWLAEFNAWLARPDAGGPSTDPVQQLQRSEPEQQVPEGSGRLD